MNESGWPSNVSDAGVLSGTTSAVPCHEHWRKFPPPRPEVHYVVGTLLVLIGTTGALGNSLVLFVFTRFKRLRGPASSFIINLAIADLANSLLHSMAATSSFRGRWSFGATGCVVYACGVGFFGLLSIVTLAAIAVERYMVITAKPFSGNWKITQYAARKVCVLVWLYCMLMSLPPLFGWSSYLAEGFLTSCSWDYLSRTPANRAYYIYLLSLGFVLPVTIISYCYTFILAAIYQHGKEMAAVKKCQGNSGYHRGGKSTYTSSHQPSSTSNARQQHYSSTTHNSTFKTAEIIFRLVVLFMVSWSPYSIVTLIGQFGDASLVTPWSVTLSALFAKASVVYNPIIYGLSHPHFRSSIKTYLSSFNAAPSNNTAFLRPNSPTMPATAMVAIRAGAAAAAAAGAHRSQVSLLRMSEPQQHQMHLRCSGSFSESREVLSEPVAGGESSDAHKHRFVTNRIQHQQLLNKPHLTLHHVTLHWEHQSADSASRAGDDDVTSGVVCSPSLTSRCPPPRAICVFYDSGSVCCHVTQATCSAPHGHCAANTAGENKDSAQQSI